MAQPLIINIQKFSIHDGAGIRTTVFFKGCPLRCAWCHNPESQSFEAETLHYPERCIHCGKCAEGCPTGALEQVGDAYSVEALSSLLEQDRIFFDSSGGGVTLSGGEVMAQDENYLLALLKRLTRRGVSVNIDTCGHAPYSRFEAVMPYVDTFLYDIKAMDPKLHKRFTGVTNRLILDNIRRLSADGARIHVRVPVIPMVNGEGGEMERIIRFVAENVKTTQVNLLPYHRLGQEKGKRLDGRTLQTFHEPMPEAMEALKEAWQEAGFDAVLIGG